MNFLQQHYNQYRQAGGGHASYVVINDLSDEMAAEILKVYNEMHPEPVSEEKQQEFRDTLRKENDEAELKDDIAWLTGTGRYSQG